MTPKKIRVQNLTRWNRARLERFRYIDGNAVTFLEKIREGLATAFPKWKDVAIPIPADETKPETEARIIAQYGAPRREWAWEIARSFARATHILTEHANAFANEGYISTATQWDYLRRLVALLDYHPRPPASASTTLALIAKPDKGVGTIKAGFQVKYAPEDGSPPVIFETLEDIEVDSRLNEVRLDGWDHNPSDFDPFRCLSSPPLWILPEDAEVSVGQRGVLLEVLLDRIEANAVTVGKLSDDRKELELAKQKHRNQVLGDTHLLLAPDNVYLPRLNGVDVLRLGNGHWLAAKQVIGWKKESIVGFARVVAADRTSVQVTDIVPLEDITGPNVSIYATGAITQPQFVANNREWRFAPDAKTAKSSFFRIAVIAADGSIGGSLKTRNDLDEKKADHAQQISYTFLPSVTADAVHFFNSGNDKAVATTLSKPAGTQLDFDGGIGRLKSGDYMVGENSAGHIEAVRIKSVIERDDSFSLELCSAPAKDVKRLHGPFALDLRPLGYDRDPRPVDPANLRLEFDSEALPAGLTAGKTIVVEPEDDAAGALPFKAIILEIEEARGSKVRLVLDAAAEQWGGHTRGNLIIRGNAVAAGHGETRPSIPFGSGDAAQTNQSFTLKKEKVSFRANSSLPQGVRAAVKISVGERLYEEVSTLANSEATDAHYVVHMTEEGYLQVIFGDGFHGRQLPTGANNIAVSYRVGTGSAGNNLPPGSLEKEVKPHNFVAAIRQPLSTSGGQEMEDINQVRQNAPAYLRALDRGVSLPDVEYLAGSQPGVWHARAFLNPAGAHKHELIELTIVPADGGALGDLKQALEKRLVELSPPGIEFKAARFDPVPLSLRITLRVDTDAFDYSSVEKAVRNAVYQSFKLERRAPGRPVYRAEVYASIKSVTGVANADVLILPVLANSNWKSQPDPIRSEGKHELRRVSRGAAGEIRTLWPTNRQVVFLPDPAAISIIRRKVII